MNQATVFIFLSLSIFSVSLADNRIHAAGWCSLYDQCGYNLDLSNPEVRGQMACVNNRPAENLTSDRPLSRNHLRLYKEVCPMMIDAEATEARVCCAVSQLNTLRTQLVASELLFERCPSCIYNFKTLYCQTTCSPDQSLFINVTKTYQNPNFTNPGSAIQDVILSERFAYGMHGSCNNVVFPQTNGKAITLMCNGYSGDQCTPQSMLNYLGSTGNGVAPVDMNFYIVGNTSSDAIPEPPPGLGFMDFDTPACNEAPTNDSVPCSCTDCELMCPERPPPVEQIPFLIGDADGVGVIVLIVFLTLSIFFLIYAGLMHMKRRKSNKSKKILPKQSTSSTAQMKNWSDNDTSSDSSCFTNDYDLIDESEISRFDRLGKASQDFFKNIFQRWGTFVASHPLWIILVMVILVIVLCIGMKFIILTMDPIDLWTSETSRVLKEKNYYDEKFGAFFRTEQVIMTLKPEYEKPDLVYTSYTGVKHNFSEIISIEYILELLKLQNHLRYMSVIYEDNGENKVGTLNDICFKPLEPDNNNCTITSIANYWRNDPDEMMRTTNYTNRRTNETYHIDFHDHFLYCVQAPAALVATHPLLQSCLGDFGGPVFPYLAVGGQPEDAPYNNAKAFILTFVIRNFPKGDNRTALVKSWEKKFLEVLSEWNTTHFDYAYFSERSPEEELERSTETDLVVFIASYVVIFVYITIALGTYTSFRRIPVDSKVSLGLAGILVILSSVFTSIGFLGYVGYSTSLIVIEVVPFLVLAIGADNVFILTLEYQKSKRRPDETLPEHVGRVFGEVAPSMLLCSLTESVTFFLGTLTEMPAIEEFAFAAALAILFDFILQITVFLAVLSLDARRQEANRFDIFCCVQSETTDKESKSFLQSFFQNYYAPFLMNDIVRAIVMVGFTALCCWCTLLTSRMTIGLDQDLSVPLDSYVLTYFDYMEKYLDVGAPVYFVTKNPYNFANEDAAKHICAFAGCEPTSLVEQISYASTKSEYWRIETPAASWYDDYTDWLTPRGSRSCCRFSMQDNVKEFCPSTDNDEDKTCVPCIRNSPSEEEFIEYLPWFLIDNPGLKCSKGGHSAYGNSVNITKNYLGVGVEVVEASYFMSYHSVCIKSVDCTENLIKARELADNITATLKAANTDENGYILGNEDDFTVFPYCLYYVYYEQYLTMVDDSFFLIGVCLVPAFVFSFILLGFDFFSGFVTLITILMIIVDTAGFSSIWGVHLNAVSLINLVQAIGLSIEFISHVVHTFSMKTQLSRKDRVIEAMGTMGPAVFAGVALTNLPGIIVLNWATAQLIQVFFFRMCLVITLLGMAHGLIFLPVFLSYFGPSVNKAILYEKQQKEREERLKSGVDNTSFKQEDLYMKIEEKTRRNSSSTDDNEEGSYEEVSIANKDDDDNTHTTKI